VSLEIKLYEKTNQIQAKRRRYIGSSRNAVQPSMQPIIQWLP